MNSSPIDLPLLLRVVDALEPREEPLLRVDVHERHVEVAAERLDHLLGLVLAQQAVVDEDARELVADRLVHEQRGDRRVDAAGQRAEHALAADLRADPLDLLLDHRGRRPGRRRAGDVVEEVLQHVLPVRRVHDLGVELDAVERRARRPRTRRSASTASRRRRARPSGGAVTESRWLIQTVCSAGRPANSAPAPAVELGLAELGDAGPVDRAAELQRHQLHAVADAERRDAELEQLRVDARRALGVDRRRPAGEDQRDAGSARAPRPRASVCGTSSE